MEDAWLTITIRCACLAMPAWPSAYSAGATGSQQAEPDDQPAAHDARILPRGEYQCRSRASPHCALQQPAHPRRVPPAKMCCRQPPAPARCGADARRPWAAFCMSRTRRKARATRRSSASFGKSTHVPRGRRALSRTGRRSCSASRPPVRVVVVVVWVCFLARLPPDADAAHALARLEISPCNPRPAAVVECYLPLAPCLLSLLRLGAHEALTRCLVV